MPRNLREFREAYDPAYKFEAVGTEHKRTLRPTHRWIITSAQNATPVDASWWSVLLNMASNLDAELLVIPLRYKNATSIWSGSQQNAEWWAPEVRPYLWNVRHALHPALTLLADIKAQPTAQSPLSGLEGISGASHAVVAHTRVQLKTVPAGNGAKILTTTGACTVANYTSSRAGALGEFHHSLAAVLVEADGDVVHIRNLHFDSDTASCIDLNVRYTADGSDTAPPALAIVLGDAHVDAIDPGVVSATWGADGIVDALEPSTLVWHDVFDGLSCNPHTRTDPIVAVSKTYAERSSVRAEVHRAIDFVASHTPRDSESVIVASNHDDFLRRWLANQDWRTDPENAEFYLETALAMVRQASGLGMSAETLSPFVHWVSAASVDRVRCLAPNELFTLANVELGMHGDVGPNGARGSIRNLRRVGAKSIVGHSHSPGIDEGCYQVGTSSRLRLGYNRGPSGWMHAHVVLLANGKRQLIVMQNGKWRRST